jgi:tRNA (mo5U34)-methyltransferase
MTEQEIRDGVAARQWKHQIRLPHGIVTPGSRDIEAAWKAYHLPEDLSGQSVLDIGAWDGGFSFESERRSASSVVAMDVWDTKDEPGSGGYGWDNYQFAHDALSSQVQTLNRSILDPFQVLKTYDLILFLEVLYHLQEPIYALHRVRSMLSKGGVCCLETWIDAEWINEPAMIFYPGAELAGDPTNWWGPNIKCVQSMAVSVGFVSCEVIWEQPDVHLGGRGKRACFHLR